MPMRSHSPIISFLVTPSFFVETRLPKMYLDGCRLILEVVSWWKTWPWSVVVREWQAVMMSCLAHTVTYSNVSLKIISNEIKSGDVFQNWQTNAWKVRRILSSCNWKQNAGDVIVTMINISDCARAKWTHFLSSLIFSSSLLRWSIE